MRDPVSPRAGARASRVYRCLAVALSAWLASCAAAGTPVTPAPLLESVDPAEAGFAVDRLARIDSLIEADVAAGFPGAVLVVLRHGRLVKATAYGHARLHADGGVPLPAADREPMRLQTLFDLASNTKMYATNYAAMKLVAEGRLDVDRPVRDYLPAYAGGQRDSVTVRQVLTHSAGYAPEVLFFRRDNELGEAFYSQDPATTRGLLLGHVPFLRAPGERAVYSDTDYMLAGLLVEAIVDMPLDAYVEQQLYAPLGLRRTCFNPLDKGFAPADAAATEIQGNTRDGRIEFPNVRRHVLQGEVHDEKAFYCMGGVSGHAGLFSTAPELAVLAQLMLDGGRRGDVQLFDAATIARFTAPSAVSDGYGIGWRRAGREGWRTFGPHASEQAFGHTGWTGTVTLIDPAHELVAVLLTNAKHSAVVDGRRRPYFEGDRFTTARFGRVLARVYEAFLPVPVAPEPPPRGSRR